MALQLAADLEVSRTSWSIAKGKKFVPVKNQRFAHSFRLRKGFATWFWAASIRSLCPEAVACFAAKPPSGSKVLN